MPLYAYVCPTCQGESEEIRHYAHRLDPLDCPECGAPMEYRISAHHAEPDGIYSYAPNIGSEQDFVRKRDAIKAGKKLVKRYEPE